MPIMDAIEKAFVGAERLTQVVFVHDYIQLAFQDLRLSVYCAFSIISPGTVLNKDSRGFCDKLVGLIGQRAVSVRFAPSVSLVIAMEKGDTVSLSLRDVDVIGPECFQITQPGQPIIVE